MSLDFKEMKDRIKLVDVLLHYNVRLRKKPDEDYASAACPLPCHPKKPNNAFGVHLPTNRWQCKDTECGKKNGVGDRWGDCLNLVMTMSNYGFRQAANQLDTWFPPEIKNPALVRTGEVREAKKLLPSQHTEPTSSALAVNGYMKDTEVWFLELTKPREGENDEARLKRVVNGIKQRCLDSYRAGKAQR